MFLFVEGENEIKNKLDILRKENKSRVTTLQAIVVILKDKHQKPAKFFVSVDDILYIQTTVLAAIDLCFKVKQNKIRQYKHCVSFFSSTYIEAKLQSSNSQ